MKHISWIIIFVFSILALSILPIKADQWFKIAPHNHTNNSDGLRSFADLAKTTKLFDFDVLIVTDHVEKISQKKGFGAYLQEFQTDQTDLTVISGIEVAAENSHTVVFGQIGAEIMRELNRNLTTLEIISLAQENNLLAVAAHPFDLTYLYDRNQADEINGIEFFNGLIVDYTMTFNWYKKMIDQGKNVFCWAGIDSHTALDSTDKERWQRQTWVYARSNLAEDICDALSKGHSYASRFSYKLEDLNLIPGFEYQKAAPRFKFKVVSKVLYDKTYRINLYRDNEVVKFWLVPIGVKTKAIDFLDEKCPPGRHTYLIEAMSLLITSPIRLEVEKKEKPAQSKKTNNLLDQVVGKIKDNLPEIGGVKLSDIFGSNEDETTIEEGKAKSSDDSKKSEDIVTSGTGYLNLLGLDFKGVIARLKQQPDATWQNEGSISGDHILGWVYRNKPIPGYTLNVHFDHYENRSSEETLKIVHMTNTVCRNDPKAVLPSKIVPLEIWNSAPQMILRARASYPEDSIAVLWFRGDLTYCAILSDTKRKLESQQQYIDSKGLIAYKILATPAVKNFRSCDRLLAFVCVDCLVDPFKPLTGLQAYNPTHKGSINFDAAGCAVFEFDKP